MRNHSSIQVVCVEYERMLTKSQATLTSWANASTEISGCRGKDIYNRTRLRALQRDFLKVWGLLQNHKRDCEVCQVTSIFKTVHSVTDGDLCQQLYH
jgi:hypothetical protein